MTLVLSEIPLPPSERQVAQLRSGGALHRPISELVGSALPDGPPPSNPVKAPRHETHVRAAIHKAREELEALAAGTGSETIVVKCSHFVEGDLACVFHAEGTSFSIIVPKSGLVNFDFTDVIGRSLELKHIGFIDELLLFSSFCSFVN